MAASATFALKAGAWFRRARLLIVSPDSRVNLARRQAETPLIPLFRFLRPALKLSTKSGGLGRVFMAGECVERRLAVFWQLSENRLHYARITTTGILQWVSTFTVSLPSTIAEMPRRPWDAIKIASHPASLAVSIMAS